MIYLFIVLPVVLAFAILWYVDAFLEQRIGKSPIVAIVGIGIALVIFILSVLLFVYNFT